MAKHTHSEIEELVLRFQQGDEQAGADLVEALTPLLAKYVNMLTGKVDVREKSQRFFMGLFVPDPGVRREILKDRFDRSVLARAWKYYNVALDTMKGYPIEDLWQDLRLMILYLAKRYRQLPRKQFLNYVQGSLPYMVSKLVKNIGRDPAYFSLNEVYPYCDKQAGVCEESLSFEEGLIDDSGFDELWISGETCSEAFSKLTRLERCILKMKYLDGYTDTMIAERMGLSASAIAKRRHDIVRKLRRALDAELG